MVPVRVDVPVDVEVTDLLVSVWVNELDSVVDEKVKLSVSVDVLVSVTVTVLIVELVDVVVIPHPGSTSGHGESGPWLNVMFPTPSANLALTYNSKSKVKPPWMERLNKLPLKS
mmetsp:Transcript_48547/g.125980  ORF Transcript_48547/g.125980 Transcript_48547/m.125980 type:complete len:114 (+) Transcript_48547:732-1073(+)